MWRLMVGAGLAGVVTCVQAANVAAEPERGFFEELPVVLSATRMSQPVSRAPAAVTVLDRKMIEASGFREIVDLMRLVPGFQVGRQQNNYPAVAYHGLASFTSRSMQVTIDGRSVYNPAFGTVEWRALPITIDDIERIEVVRGPNAANDGMNAFLASINIVTRDPAIERGWSVGVSGGDPQVTDTTLRGSGHHGDGDWRATLASRADRYYDNIPDSAKDVLANVRADVRLGGGNELMLQAGVTLGDWGEGRYGFVFSPPRRAYSRSDFVQAKFRHVVDTDNEWSIHLHHSRQDVDERYVMPTAGLIGVDIPHNLDWRVRRSALEFAANTRLTPTLRTSWGAEARYDAGWSPTYTSRNDWLDGWRYRLFGATEWALRPDLIVHAGAMLEHHYYVGAKISPRLAVNWLPAADHSLRLGIARGYRTPTFLEQQADTRVYHPAAPVLLEQSLLSTADLAAERILTRELGYVVNAREIGLQADFRVFHNRLDQLIDLTTVALPPGTEAPGIGDDLTDSFANLQQARQRGVDAHLRWQPRPDTWLVVNPSVVSTRSNTPRYAESAPRRGLSLLFSHTFAAGLAASLGYYMSERMEWVGSANGASPRYERLDARLAKTFRIDRQEVQLTLVMQNLLRSYVEYPPYGNVDRRVFGSLRLSF